MTSKIKRIAVTGGFGFIGARFVKHLLKNTDYHVRIIDKRTYAADPNRVFERLTTEERFRVEQLTLDICDVIPINFRGCEYVVNFAAESHVDNSISDGKPFIRSNVEGTFNLIECVRQTEGIKKFVQISTDEVYGDMADLRGTPAATESFKLKPSSYYSASKASADLLVEAAARTYGIPYLITRSCNNFGPGQHTEKFIPKLLECVKDDAKFPLYGDGQQRREWIHVDDNCDFIFKLMFTEDLCGVYNIGTGMSLSNLDIINLMQTFTKQKIKWHSVEDRLGHDKVYLLDSSKLASSLRPNLFFKFNSLEDFFESEFNRLNIKQRYVAG